MRTVSLPVFKISNFKDYNNCTVEFESNFYIRKFKDHLCENCFLEKPHGHDFYLMLVVTSGSGKHYIDTKEYEVTSGSFFVIPPGQIHKWELSDNTDGYVLFFTKKYFLLDYNTQKFKNFPFLKSTFNQPHLLLNYNELNDVVSIYEKIHKEYFERKLNFNEMTRLCMGEMFLKLARMYHHRSSTKSISNYELMQLTRYENLIEEYYKEHKSIPFYAEKMELTIKQLSYLCKQVMDKTPSEMIVERVILEAKRLIIHTDLSIAQISSLLNYSESSYFNRLFKKECLKTPEKYRNTFSQFVLT